MFDEDLDIRLLLGNDQKADLENLLQKCRANLPKVNEKQIVKAFDWCVSAHKNQVRKSGEPYYTHPLNVALIIASEMPLDDVSVISALLHEVTRHTGRYSINDIRAEFGPTVSDLVDSIQKIHHVENYNINEMDNYRRLLLSLFKDVRIILIKLADRLHNMRTIHYLEKRIQQKMARETLEIYAPFANRFGLGNIKWELEDQAFKVLNYETYKTIRETIQLSRKEREKYLSEFIKPIRHKLSTDPFFASFNIDFDIKGRAKHIYSIYNKTILRDKPVEELYDIFAIRIILDTDNHHMCYVVLSIISDIYETMPGTYKNYISNPKKNGYQSIHIALFGKDKKPVEVQIRTKKMDLVAEKGLAAHFKYKTGFIPAQSVLTDEYVEDWLDQIRSVFETMGDEPPEKLIESVKRSLLFDEIYVFTPTNEFRTLPKDATALDFAYGIHTELGNHCIGAKVNGKVVPIDYKLQSGDVIEILTSKTRFPQKDWLNYVFTQKAISSIKKYLKDERRRKIQSGKAIWRDTLQSQGIELSLRELRQVVEMLNFVTADEFYLSLSEGLIHVHQLLACISSVIDTRNFTNDNQKLIDINLPIKQSTCCYPLPGDNIIGEINPGVNIMLHRRRCNKTLESLSSRKIAIMRMQWNNISLPFLVSKIIIRAIDHPNIKADITKTVMNLEGIIFKAFKTEKENEDIIATLTVNIKIVENFKQLLAQLGSIDNVKSVERYIE